MSKQRLFKNNNFSFNKNIFNFYVHSFFANNFLPKGCKKLLQHRTLKNKLLVNLQQIFPLFVFK